jgi:heat-inducible transcriptional repressor
MSAETVSSLPNERASHLLRVLIQRYIREGEPVGSRTLSRDSGLDLSPATIRNVMADLEEMGLVSAPHTSAGRVPTAKGYRLFVDTLVRYRQPRGNDLRRLQSQLQQNVDDPDSLISSVSNMLSEITSLAGVVTVTGDSRDQRSRSAEPYPAPRSGILRVGVDPGGEFHQ